MITGAQQRLPFMTYHAGALEGRISPLRLHPQWTLFTLRNPVDIHQSCG